MYILQLNFFRLKLLILEMSFFQQHPTGMVTSRGRRGSFFFLAFFFFVHFLFQLMKMYNSNPKLTGNEGWVGWLGWVKVLTLKWGWRNSIMRLILVIRLRAIKKGENWHSRRPPPGPGPAALIMRLQGLLIVGFGVNVVVRSPFFAYLL